MASENENDYSPLQGNVQEKDYASSKNGKTNEVIPEPNFNAPPSFNTNDFFDGLEEDEPKREKSAYQSGNNGEAVKRVTKEPLITDSNELTDKEKKRGAEQLAQTFIEGYSLLCNQSAKLAMIRDEKVVSLIREGKIDPYTLYFAPGNVQATAPEIIKEYNNEMMGVMEVSQDFVDEVKPPLIRVLMKRGMVMTDEQKLMWVVGKDVATKGAMLLSIRKQSKDFLKSFTIVAGSQQQIVPDRNVDMDSVKKEEPKQENNKDNNDFRPEVSQVFKENRQPDQYHDFSDTEPSKQMRENAPGDFFDPINKEASMTSPEFGNEDVLDKIEELAGEDSIDALDSKPVNKPVRRKRGRPKKK